ncbi:nucleotide-binding protein [Bradyrhizobium sp. CCGB20]|uniref:nucleotide-binding protein n=1 Tax=Bradyrhizobium sp. CCGB20 TaxID=2949633 RepID=UPI0020B40655|nr:nucleotide-binding protein [Bradyrhizobium sp. CCGB20]MCP3395686.1 nucleotide-binding protein [Bradyrhizobium sp. CCGB20]
MTKQETSFRVFYSWQSDSPATTNLNAIRSSLDKAFKLLNKTQPELKIVRDEATRDTSGSPNIALKILEKIEAADVFVADITTITPRGAKRPCPNPNVSYELGYAVAMLGWERVILLFNKAIGDFPNDVPFDFIQNRISDYHLEESDPKDKKAALAEFLKHAIGAVIAKNPKKPEQLRGQSREKIEHDHDVENMRWLMNSLHLPTLDQLIDELPHMIVDRSFWFYENFKGVVVNSLFSLYDKALDEAVRRLLRAWTTAISHSGQYHELRGGHAHIFTNPGDMPLPPDRKAVWDKINAARYEMKAALDTILNRLRTAYIDVNIRKTNEAAWNEYLAQRAEDRKLLNLATEKPLRGKSKLRATKAPAKKVKSSKKGRTRR